ncbi:MAG: glycoside hydrolase family 27 protein [Dysgonamonadaceae bacterium]|jgi:alpha-galactosidase|nr:glycoside hydrolase family 27 protein [Dysgonamonadaceae bacterium]
MKRLFFPFFILLISSNLYCQKFENLAQTPPMGWNSWNKFACDISENIIREIADAMVSTGLKDAGYEYIVIDDCWHGKRDSLGFIQADPERFPSGIKALADYVHSKGLKFGIYSDAGRKTCGGRPGSFGHEYQDALQYARWNVDFLKYDWCETENINPIGAYTLMRDALHAAGRPILFSMCEWGTSKPWEWAQNVGHMWRTTGDISNCFEGIEDRGTWHALCALTILDTQDSLRKYAGPGHWNDPDMLEVGNGMPANEDRAHFSMWAMICAPLILGNDIRNMAPETKAILENKEVIAVNQDKLGIQALKYGANDEVETWFKPLKNGDWAVCFLNRSKEDKTIEILWTDYAFTDEISGRSPNFDKTTYQLKNLWTNEEEGNTKEIIKKTIPSRDVLMYRIIKNI